MSNQPNTENRSYSRIATFTRARYRKLSHPDEPQICPSGFNIEASGGQRFMRESGLPEALVSFLMNMDAKLDRIIAQMSKDSLASYFPDELVVLDLSAAGILAQSNDIKPGDYLEVVLYLGEFPPVVVSGVAEVLRSGKEMPGVGKTFALQFTRLRDTEREKIVRFVFKEERARIRTEKFK